MANTCYKLTMSQKKTCLSLLTDGNESTLYIANRSDIAGYIRDELNPNLIRGIQMAVGASFFVIEGSRDTLKPKFTSVKKNYATKYRHELDGVVFNWNSSVKVQMEAFNEGTFVCIVINKDRANDATFEIYGTDVGMVAKDGMIRDVNSADFGANLPIGLMSDENQEEPHMPASFSLLGTDGKHSYTNTLNALRILLLPAS